MKLITIFLAFVLLPAFAFQYLAQKNHFPNELKEFEFFGRGKLKGVSLGLSTKKDVNLIFGESCENYCDYDENFRVKVTYLAEDDCMTTRTIRDRAVCPLDEFIGTIFSVEFTPKQSYNFRDFNASKFDVRSSGGLIEKGSGVEVSYSSFGDAYGLSYSIHDKTLGANESNKPIFVKGDLYSITYSFPEELESKVFRAKFKPKK